MLHKKLRVYKKVLDKIKKSKNILCLSHKNPDLDTVGSATGIYQILKDNFLEKNIDLVCVDNIPLKYDFLGFNKYYKNDFNPDDYDLIIFLDSGSKTQTGFDLKYPKLYDKISYNTLNIDHHPTNEVYGKQNVIITKYSSTTMIITELFLVNGLYISSKASTCLLSGLYTDTGAFKHSNTDKTTFFIASKLFELGGDFQLIVNNFFKNNSLKTIKLWGKILSESFIDEDNIMNAYVNKTMLDSYDTTYDEISGVIDYLNMAEGINYTKLLTQKGEFIKGSLRTLKDDIDLTKIASLYNGGGHKKASGFTLQAKVNTKQYLNLITK
ncbi:MAG: bifunctional oligoribonuclease/PAP phosphatase NrnA [Candidatus Gracilibacteria bacterium]|nr:bifunctional oligoribonuclease/PAP phosphatase NrnA [Candidatus Gracilibacteria bacterium]